jgi:sulfate-transporting ATPase
LVAIARAVATSPSVLLLDEPAAGLDQTETGELAVLIRRLAVEWGLAVIVIEHDMSLVLSTCDRIEVLDRGRHLATGTPDEIRHNQAVVNAYLGVSADDEPKASPTLPFPQDQNAVDVVSSRGARNARTDTPVLQASDLSAGYGDLAAVRGICIKVWPGEIVALLGSNGAGKTTTLRALAGWLSPLAGEVCWKGQRSTAPLHRRVQGGLAFVPEDRSVFFNLSVAANLRAGRGDPSRAVELFPELGPLLSRRAGLLSGGEQQILTVARALAAQPLVLLADELSIGLAPKVVERLFAAIRHAADEGLAVVLVDQNAERALAIADRVMVLNRGTVVLDGAAESWRGHAAQIFDSYLVQDPAQHIPTAPSAR